jgi:DNA-binding HxlR family transcriptional regulator
MRSYSQVCGVAKGLDLIGDRWTLLIVRELLIRHACRYTDLRKGLPGIATNLLAQRLRELEQAGIVFSEQAPPPVATTLFRLTERGRALEPVIKAIGDWARPHLAQIDERDTFQIHWLVLPMRFYLQVTTPDAPPVGIQLDTDDEPLAIEAADGKVTVRVGRLADPDLVLTGPAQPIGRLMLGRMNLSEARKLGVKARGDLSAFKRLKVKAPEGTSRNPPRPSPVTLAP